MPYQKPSVETQRVGLPGTPLGNTAYYIPVVIAQTLGAETDISRTATVSGDSYSDMITINGQIPQIGDTLNFERTVFNSTTKKTAGLSQLPVRTVLSVSSDPTNPYKRQYIQGVDFTVTNTTGILDFTNAPALPNASFDTPALTEVAGGGAITANTYNIAVMATDANGNTTLADTATIIVAGSTSAITVRWAAIQGASGYKIYAKRSTDTAAQYSLPTAGTISLGTTTSVSLTVAITAGALSLPAYNTTQHIPVNNDQVYVNYTYMVWNYNSPKRYFDTNVLQQDHGVGSEVANAARLIMGPAGIGNAAGSMYVVAPAVASGSIVGYQDAISACESIQDLVLISTSSSADAVNQTLVAHCADMSQPENAKDRFCLLSTTSAIMANTDVTQLTNKILALNGSNRAMYVVVDGGHPTIQNWQNTPDNLCVITNTTQAASYTANLAVDGPWAAIATTGMIAALTDPAVPPTNKQVYGMTSGIAGTVRLWNDSRKNAIASAGGMILEDRFNNLFVRHALTVSQASVEDSEASIVLAEGYMAKSLRDGHQQFIGQKLTDTLIRGVSATTKKILDGLVGNQIIGSYVTGSLKVYQDSINPTKVNIVFSYKPVYPTNNLLFNWSFNLAG